MDTALANRLEKDAKYYARWANRQEAYFAHGDRLKGIAASRRTRSEGSETKRQRCLAIDRQLTQERGAPTKLYVRYLEIQARWKDVHGEPLPSDSAIRRYLN